MPAPSPYLAHILDPPPPAKPLLPVTDTERIIMVVASLWGYMPEELKRARQSHNMADARATCIHIIYAANKHRPKNLSNREIGFIFGIDHSSVNSLRRAAIERLVRTDFRNRMFRAMDMLNL